LALRPRKGGLKEDSRQKNRKIQGLALSFVIVSKDAQPRAQNASRS
jgi:hypothetical protein